MSELRSHLTRLSAATRGAAHETLSIAARIEMQHDVDWRSTAAQAFRHDLAQAAALVRGVAAAVDEVALDLQQLAGRLP